MQKLKLTLLSALLCFSVMLIAQKESTSTSIALTSFSWEEYTEDKGCQPRQGPCVSFSVVKTMEIMHNIENDNECRNLNFSIPYLDYAGFIINEIFDWAINNGTAQESCGDLTDLCYEEARQKANAIIVQDKCFAIQIEGDNPNCADVNVVESAILPTERIFADNISFKNNSLKSAEMIKNYIQNTGPLFVIIRDFDVLNHFGPYTLGDGETLQFHSFVILGWEDVSANVTKWIIDDHWPTGTSELCRIRRSPVITNAQFGSFITTQDVKFYGIHGVEIRDPNDQLIPCPLEPPLPPGPTVIDIHYHSDCLSGNTVNTIVATTDCIVPAAQYEWKMAPGAMGSHSTGACSSTGMLIPNNLAEIVFVSVRARSVENGVWSAWSPWYVEEFCSEGTGGGGPAAGTPIRYKY